MLAITISWIVISIVFLSFGDFFIFLYNRLCKQNEQYKLTDTLLLGMCVTLIPLSATSFCLPSNQYILLAYIILSTAYWIIRRSHFQNRLKQLKARLKSFSVLQIIAFIIPTIGIMIAILWQVGVFDSLFYHQQNIRWNEEYAVVPGLGNLEHRFAFNSNYFLLSAIFSFRFLFGEAIYSLHVLILIYVLCWILKEIIVSGYEIKRVLLLVIFTGYIFIFGYSLASTSTDAIPNIISFYLIAKLLLYPESAKKDLLLYICVPIALITFKVSILPLCLLSLYTAYWFLREKQHKAIAFSFTVSALIVLLWLTRNVIISGYLIFPFSEIDLFTVDWKIPKAIAIEEKDFIYSCGIRLFDDIVNQLKSIDFSIQGIINWLTNFWFVGFALLSPFVVLYSYIKKKYLDKTVYLVYIILISIFAVWYIGGPDPRFIGGTLFAFSFFVLFLIISGKKEKQLKIVAIPVMAIFVVIMALWPITRTQRFFEMFSLSVPKGNMRPVSDVYIRPYPYKELLRSAGLYKDDFYRYPMNNDVSIYISETPTGLNLRYGCFDSPFPCTVSSSGVGIKYLDVTQIEPRGNSLQDGFRVKTSDK